MTRFLSEDEAHAILDRMYFKVRDEGLLSSALYRPRSAYMGVEAYPTLPFKAGALLHSLAMNHPLFDGNKRFAWVATRAFLVLNGHDSGLRGDGIVAFMLGVVGRQDGFDEEDPVPEIAMRLLVYPRADL